MTYISFLLLFCSFFLVYLHSVCRQRRGVTLKSNRSRSLKMGPISIDNIVGRV